MFFKTLFDEQWYAIGILLLEQSARSTLFSLVRVNKRFYEIFLPLVYRRCTLRFTAYGARKRHSNSDTQLRILRFLERDPDDLVFRAIRNLTIFSTKSDDPQRRGQLIGGINWTPLIEFIRRLKRLEIVTFDCPESVPLDLLTVLEEYHPSSHLHVRNWTRKSRDVRVGDPHEEALARSACLRSIDGDLEESEYKPINTNEAAFRRIVALAPNIECASLKSHISQDWSYSARLTDEDREEQELERTRLEIAGSWRRKTLKKLGWNEIRPATIKQLEKNFNLEALDALDAGLFHRVGIRYAIEHDTFQRLRHLSFEIPSWESSVPNDGQLNIMDFICSLSNLQSLSVTNHIEHIDLPTLFQYHGSSLRSLSLHEIEDPEHNRRSLAPAEITHIQFDAPNLEALTMDMNRNRDPTDVYAALSMFKRLRQLTLQYDLGLVRRYGPYCRPDDDIYKDVDASFAEAAWESITRGGRGGGACYNRTLDKLTVNIGEQQRQLNAAENPPDWVLHERRARRQFDVMRNQRDDEPDGVSVFRHRDSTDEDREAEARKQADFVAGLLGIIFLRPGPGPLGDGESESGLLNDSD
ncbi:hypothetical protein AAF712_006642 [Marasmius tenuissimus]|uniref:F-box domain-containing protein n=1 Tax=Marasmius tenuissimus TaxID=585030 RepID=A0ABR2ZYC9_9AGAR